MSRAKKSGWAVAEARAKVPVVAVVGEAAESTQVSSMLGIALLLVSTSATLDGILLEQVSIANREIRLERKICDEKEVSSRQLLALQ